ncbi:MAG: ribosome maturation factor RimP [Thermodesulfobacteriota bacterium]
MNRERISSLWEMIEPVIEPEGIELVELEFRPEGGKWVLRLYIDSPSGVTLDDCEMISRQVGALLDIKDPIGHAYHLEVSSPGINRVLRKAKDFERYAGSPVRVRTSRKVGGRRNFRGILRGAQDANIIVEIEGDFVRIGLEDVEKARLDLSEEDLFREDLRRRAGRSGD